MENKASYWYYGFIDFLSYYIPGAAVLLVMAISNVHFRIGVLDIDPGVEQYSRQDSVISAIWIGLLIVLPYIIGHLIFPMGAVLGDLGLRRGSSNCARYRGRLCSLEGRDFTRCAHAALGGQHNAFVDYWLIRHRTLSRFCKSMLLPMVLFALLFALLATLSPLARGKVAYVLYLWGLSAFSLVSCFGLKKRYEKYERRWRAAVCYCGTRDPGGEHEVRLSVQTRADD